MKGLLSASSARARLTLWNLLVLAFVLLAVGTVLRVAVARSFMDSVDKDLVGRSQRHINWWRSVPDASHNWSNRDLKSNHAEPSPPTRSGQRPQTKLTPPAPLPMSRWGIVTAERVFDLNGRESFPGHGREAPWDWKAHQHAVKGQASFTFAYDEDVHLRVYTVPLIRQSGEIAGVAQIAYSLTEIDRALGKLDRILLMLVPLALAATSAGGMFLTGRVMRPVRDVTHAAERIGAEDLSERLQVTGKDEFSKFAATFNSMLERLERSFEQQKRFTADASHELRTPLTVIKSAASRTLAKQDLPEDSRRVMERISGAADSMGRLINNLLVLARFDAAHLGGHMRPLALSEVLGSAIAGVTLEDGPTIRNALEHSSLVVLGDSDHLIRLFSNLLDNAVRHTPAAGCITLSVTQADAWVTVIVADTGCGIAGEHISHLTERFYRVDESRTRAAGGTGLGLAICRGIAEAHGGTLRIESTVGLGTSVFVTLPAAFSSDMHIPAQTERRFRTKLNTNSVGK